MEATMFKKSATILGLALSFLMLITACSAPPKAKLENVSATALTFSTRVKNTDTKTFTFSNTGDAALTYTLSADVPWLTIGNSTGSLEPEKAATVTLIARCPQEGTVIGKVTISTNGGNGEVSTTLTCTAVPSSSYDIDFQFLGSGMTQARQQVFAEAAGLWSAVIIGDLEDVVVASGDLPATTQVCGFQTPAFVGTIDDLLIFASIAPIDGVGKILGQAGPAFIRGTTDDLTIVGCMQFDDADVAALEADGTFNEVILHEMGHVLGFGSLWEPGQGNDIDLLDEPCPGNVGATPGFKGASAVIEFGVLGKTGNPPIETNGGQGTQCSHWDEDFFDNELMTGFLGGTTSVTVNPFSALTIASMQDVGYDVDFTQAEPYSIPACSPNCDDSTLKAANAYDPWEIVLQPKGSIDANGNLMLFENH
jgi:Leishmanolysin/Viral BACON domain